jgi:DNA-binding transcriptional regulator YdaS (Cro superfamily)
MKKQTKLQKLLDARASKAELPEIAIRRELAAACKVSVAFVYQWRMGIRPIPPRYAVAIEKFFGADKISRYEILPSYLSEMKD